MSHDKSKIGELVDTNEVLKDAIHVPIVAIEAEERLVPVIVVKGESAEMDGSYEEVYDMVEATSTQRAEAFLRTIGKWRDSI